MNDIESTSISENRENTVSGAFRRWKCADGLDAQREKQRVQDRFAEEFDNILTYREISDQLVREIRGDGLEDAIEGMETNVSF